MAAIYNYDRAIGEDASGHMALSASASPLCEGERTEVREFRVGGCTTSNPHPTLSLKKGEATS